MISSKYFSDVRAVLLHPCRFFSKFSLKILYNDGFVFAFRNIALFSFALGVLLVLMGPDVRTFFVALVMVAGLIVSGVAELFVFSFSFHVFLKLMGAKKDFDETFGVVGYSTAVLVYAWFLPLLVVAPFHVLYIASAGFARVHKVSRLQSVGAMVLPVVISVVVVVFLVRSGRVDWVLDALEWFWSVRVF
ncbi:MAG: hypothetical protein DRN71_04375 [Candidatus Nanohalarchaeota archaeon]|nr:MAG: hypothetical protein DRN71_04375 [Candidatus Nanohaloarchaeota archaeon]